MHHSHEALDRAGGLTRSGLLTPLRERDFRLLWSAMCISLLGDGAFLVALAWEVYALSDAPTALSVVGIAMTVPTIAVPARRRGGERPARPALDPDRRGCGSRRSPSGSWPSLAVGGWLELWHLVVLAAVYGTGSAFFAPAFDAFVPDLPAARAARAGQCAGPARPPARAAALGPGARRRRRRGGGAAPRSHSTPRRSPPPARCCCISTCRRRGAPTEAGSVVADLRAGWRYVRERSWLWATFVSAASRTCCSWAPSRCCCRTSSSIRCTATRRTSGWSSPRAVSDR